MLGPSLKVQVGSTAPEPASSIRAGLNLDHGSSNGVFQAARTVPHRLCYPLPSLPVALQGVTLRVY